MSGETEEERLKRQKDYESERERLREHLEIEIDEDQVVDITPVSRRAPISDWGIHSVDICSIYLIDRSDGSTKSYRVLTEMFQSFDRDDVEQFYKLVKENYSTKKPEMEALVLLGDLKTMFEPDPEDDIWKNLHDQEFIEWRLFDSCGVHTVWLGDIRISMLVEKKYPLPKELMKTMLLKRLRLERESEMAFELIRFIRSQVKEDIPSEPKYL